MAKKRKQTRSGVGSLTPEQMEQFEFQAGFAAACFGNGSGSDRGARIAEQRANQRLISSSAGVSLMR
jgi:hypothetical protein